MPGRKKKVMIVLGAGSIILFWRVLVLITAYLPASASATPIGIVEVPPMSAQSANEDPALKLVWDAQCAAEKADWGRDPFEDIRRTPANTAAPAPVSLTPPPQPRLKFSGVSRSNGKWLTAYNGAIVRVGDTLQDKFKIIDITGNSIVVESEGWIFTYAIGSSEARIRPSGETP